MPRSFFDQLTPWFKFRKYFPIYIRMSVQGYLVHFCKLFGAPKGPESGC